MSILSAKINTARVAIGTPGSFLRSVTLRIKEAEEEYASAFRHWREEDAVNDRDDFFVKEKGLLLLISTTRKRASWMFRNDFFIVKYSWLFRIIVIVVV